MLCTLAAGAIASEPVQGAAIHALQTILGHAPAHGLAQAVARAGLIDLDGTVVFQSAFFIILMLVLPKLVFQPMLARIDQREARTDGARAEAKAMRHAADEQIAAYDKATSQEKRRALEERARTRANAEQQATGLITQARAETAARIDAGIAEQKRQVAAARSELQAEATTLGRQIADKIAEA
jgi:F-type H+-transporting ATPase subunit b